MYAAATVSLNMSRLAHVDVRSRSSASPCPADEEIKNQRGGEGRGGPRSRCAHAEQSVEFNLTVGTTPIPIELGASWLTSGPRRNFEP